MNRKLLLVAASLLLAGPALAQSQNSQPLPSGPQATQPQTTGQSQQIKANKPSKKHVSLRKGKKIAGKARGHRLAMKGHSQRMAKKNHHRVIAARGHNKQLAIKGQAQRIAKVGHSKRLAKRSTNTRVSVKHSPSMQARTAQPETTGSGTQENMKQLQHRPHRIKHPAQK